MAMVDKAMPELKYISVIIQFDAVLKFTVCSYKTLKSKTI